MANSRADGDSQAARSWALAGLIAKTTKRLKNRREYLDNILAELSGTVIRQELGGKDVISYHDLLPSHQFLGLHGRNIRSEKVPQRGQFFDLLRRIVVLRNEKDRKNGPLWCIRSRNTFYHADPQPFNELWR